MSKTKITAALVRPKAEQHENFYEVTIKAIFEGKAMACNADLFKQWIVQGLENLDLEETCKNDPKTDIAQDLDGQTIEITISK